MRDPAGYLVHCGNRLLRIVTPEFVGEYRKIFAGLWLQEQQQAGVVAGFRILEPDEAVELVGADSINCLCLEHDVISFPSYPSEWPLEMLCAAAEHTLNLCLKSLQHSVGLKDATPFNILFKGPNPIFVDLLSFESRDVHDPTWLAHGQFVRSFLLPALLDARYGVACHTTFFARRDGIEPEEVYHLLGTFSRFMPLFFVNVTMPTLLSARAERQSSKIYAQKRLSNPDKAKFILESLFLRLVRTMKATSIRRYPSRWTNYNETCTYTPIDVVRKTVFVKEFMNEIHPARVLDLGCNNGIYSFLASQHGAEVVAIDIDPEVVGTLWLRAKSEQANILPLVVNLARPTPAMGWRNRESLSFLERAEGNFDAVLMLALLHHLLVTDQIPLDEIMEQVSRLTTEWLIIEYVSPQDSQFIRLLRGRDTMYHWFNRDVFEKELSKFFEIIKKDESTSNNRTLYLARKPYAN